MRPPTDPILRIDAGMHNAAIRRIGVDASCTLLATASEDKSVRLWNLPSGTLSKTLRMPIGEGSDGKVYAVAVSPDGQWIAAGGWTRTGGDHWVYIFERATGNVLGRYGPTGYVINQLAISNDGRFLVAGLGGPRGLRIWRRNPETNIWENFRADRNYGGLDVPGAAFDRSGALYAVGYDGRLRRYAPGLAEPPQAVPTRSGKRPFSVALHPSDDFLAVGYSDTTAVDVYRASSLNWLFRTDNANVQGGNFQTVAWAPNGRMLYAGGTHVENAQFVVRAWDRNGRDTERRILGAANAIMHLLPCGDKATAIGSADPAFGLIDPDANLVLWRDGVIADMRGKVRDNFAASSDGTKIRFGLGQGADRPVLFDLLARKLTSAPSLPEDLKGADVRSLPVQGWESGAAPKIQDRELTLERNEISHALAVNQKRGTFILGTDAYLRHYDREGNLISRHRPPAAVWGVLSVNDGRTVIAACADGTIRWYLLNESGGFEEILALFVHAKDLRWVAWKPNGRYFASENGESLIGWHINRDWNQSADFYPVSRFRELLYRPDLIEQTFARLREGPVAPVITTIADANIGARIIDRLPAVVEVKYPPSPHFMQGGDLSIHYAVRSPAALPLKRVFVRADGKLLKSSTPPNLTLDDKRRAEGVLTVQVPAGTKRLSVYAEADGAAISQPAEIGLRMPPVAAPAIRANLFALIVGVGAYQNQSYRLGTFPANDAADLAKFFRSQEGPDRAFEKVSVLELVDGLASAQAIQKGIQWLATSVKSDDLALIYFSGHGMTGAPGNYYLLPFDFDPQQPLLTSLLYAQVLAALREIDEKGARALVILDACQAGQAVHGAFRRRGVDTVSLVNQAQEGAGRVVVLASSLANELSTGEQGERNSNYTGQLLQALHGASIFGKIPPKKDVNTLDLFPWLAQRVSQLTGNKQTPIYSPHSVPIQLSVPD